MQLNEFEKLKQKLADIPADALAEFIAEIAVTDERVLDAAEAFAERSNPSKLVAALEKQLKALRANTHFYHYREARTLVKRLDDWLDRIEKDLVPKDPIGAIDLLGAFFQADASIYECVDDSDGGVGMCYDRAAGIMADASTQAGRPQVAARWLDELMQSNDYGVRDHLYDRAGTLMNEEAIRSRIVAWQAELADWPEGKDFDYKKHSLHCRCAQFAKAIPDPELFAAIKLEGRDPNESPALAIDVAEVFLEANQPERARDFLPESEDAFWDYRIENLKLRIHEELGEGDAVDEIRWEQFCKHPSDLSARNYLERLPKSEHKHARDRMRAVVDDGDYGWRTKAEFYLDWDDLNAAAEIIESHSQEAGQSDYYTQSKLSAPLTKSHPRAATILLRGAAEQTVAQSKSKYYGYAVGYIQRLESLAGLISDWGDLPRHGDWWEAFMKRHHRKSALVAKLKKAHIELPDRTT